MTKRDQNGRFISTEDQNRSEILEPVSAEIDYEAEIKAAEEKVASLKKAQAAKAEAEKKAKAEIKKAEAIKVEEAYKNLNAAKKAYNDAATTAKKIYLETITAAKKTYNDAIQKAANDLDNADEAYDAALDEFTKNHPEGFHITLKDGDNVKTISRKGDFTISNSFDDLFDYIFRKF